MLGIDLGTTFCVVARLDERGRPATVPNRDGEILTPSAIYFASDKQVVVGQPALDLALEQPERVATLVKRRMGYAEYGRELLGRSFRPETLSAVILKKLVQDAARQVGPVGEVVVTVPAYFDDTRRKATHDAGKIAGLTVLDLIDEPSAAALAYSVPTTASGGTSGDLVEGPRTVLVYDLGGGTFDVTLVKLGRKRFQVLAIEGDNQLGGRDFDVRIVQHIAGKFREQFGTDPADDPQSLALLEASAERAKRTLSKLEQATVTCTHLGKKLQYPLSRSEFEAITADLILRTRLTTQEVLRQAGVSWPDISTMLLVGGSTHMPACAKLLNELSGRAPDQSLAVSEVVARGAAVHAGILTARKSAQVPSNLAALEGIVEISVNAHGLGVEVRSGDERLNDILIRKNTQLPAVESRVYRTAKESQSRVRVRVLQGDAHQASACIPVGECWIDGLPEGLAKGSPVQVRCRVAANGMIDIAALDMTGGTLAEASLRRETGLTDAQIREERAFVAGLEVL